MNVPLSTYRLQLNGQFSFEMADDVVEYLHDLGIHWIYASPVLQAIPGSDHGYDVVNPFVFHPETGSYRDILHLSSHLKKRGMGWLQDIVPNHMAVSTGNSLLMDVLERFDNSPYMPLFDIDWSHPDVRLYQKLMLPFLSQPFTEAIQTGELKAVYNEEKGLMIAHGNDHYPVSILTWKLVADKLKPGAESRRLLDSFEGEALHSKSLDKWKEKKLSLLNAVNQNRELTAGIRSYVEQVNANYFQLEELLSVQHSSFTYWKDSFCVINYRRFFTVNALICLDMENEENFKMFHQRLIDLYKKNIVQGFRIDHIDGLGDPAGYIRQLREATDRDCYIIAEKILEGDEVLPDNWHLQGTSGYDFVSVMNKLVTDMDGFTALRIFYEFLVPDLAEYDDLVYRSKKQMLEKYMQGELTNLCRWFHSLSNETQQLPEKESGEALKIFMCCLPVYRIYPDAIPVDTAAQKILEECFMACEKKITLPHPAYEQLKKIFTVASPDPEQQKKNLAFLRRVMQFTGPLTAKGVEDTTFYIFNHLISHNEVGDSPSISAMPIDWFHEQMVTRSKQLPLSINAGSTHDTKRGEDARMRINVLSEFVAEWKAHVLLWMDINKTFHVPIHKTSAPTANDEYFIYQSLLGSFNATTPLDEYSSRYKEYLVKSLREAKLHTNWDENNEDYEKACLNFIDELLRPGSDFLSNFMPFQKKISTCANVYSSVQTLVKIMSPGIPDIYQGSELMDLSLVDPDNRRPVDFTHRKEILNTIKEKLKRSKAEALGYASYNRNEGVEKLYVTYVSLHCRMDFPRVFYKGDYIPLYCRTSSFPVLAFCRMYRHHWIIVVAALKLSVLLDENGNIKPGAFHGHSVVLPAEAPGEWENLFNGDTVTADGAIQLKDVFRSVPFALLKGK